MKHTMIFLFIPVLFFGQKNAATVTYKNGSKRTGLADLPSEVNKKGEIRFKESEADKKELISLTELSGIEYTSPDGKNKAMGIPVTYAGKLYWVYKVYEEKGITIYTTTKQDVTNLGGVPNRSIYGKGTSFFIKYKDKEIQPILTWYDAGPLTINTFQKKANIKYILKFFKDDCPTMEKAYDNGEIKFDKTPFPFIEFYQKNCNSN